MIIIGGCNGAGKTTFANTYLRSESRLIRFLNADEIARGLSPLAPEAVAFRAGKLLLEEIRTCLARGESFALETTLSGKSYFNFFKRAREHGYRLELHYLWLNSVELAVKRVLKRVVLQNGQSVPEQDIRRRFLRSLHNVTDYARLAHEWILWDNVHPPAKLRASSQTHSIADLGDLL